MPAKPAAERPSAREIGSFLGYLAAGVALSYLVYKTLCYIALMIDKGVMP